MRGHDGIARVPFLTQLSRNAGAQTISRNLIALKINVVHHGAGTTLIATFRSGNMLQVFEGE